MIIYFSTKIYAKGDLIDAIMSSGPYSHLSKAEIDSVFDDPSYVARKDGKEYRGYGVQHVLGKIDHDKGKLCPVCLTPMHGDWRKISGESLGRCNFELSLQSDFAPFRNDFYNISCHKECMEIAEIVSSINSLHKAQLKPKKIEKILSLSGSNFSNYREWLSARGPVNHRFYPRIEHETIYLKQPQCLQDLEG